MLTDIEHSEIMEKIRLVEEALWRAGQQDGRGWAGVWDARCDLQRLWAHLYERKHDAPHKQFCDCNRCAG